MYVVTFRKNFGLSVFGFDEMEWGIYETPDKEFAIKKAKEYNEAPFVNIATEHFNVWFCEKKKWNKKTSKQIYPQSEYKRGGKV